MSGTNALGTTTNPFAAARAGQPGPDDVGIIVGGQSLYGWQDVAISRGIERFPSSFDLTLTERYPDQAGQIDIKPGQPIKVTIGSTVILTGYVDRYAASASAEQHQVTISGRGMCQDLVDCSAELTAFQVNNTTLVGLAKKLCAPFGISVIAQDGDSAVMPNFNPILTETPYEIMERIGRWSAFLIYEDTTGAVVIAKLGDAKMASGFGQGENVQEASVSYSADQRYTKIIPVWLSSAFALNGVSNIPEIVNAGASDTTFPARADGQPRYRPLIVVSEQAQAAPDLAAQRAQWEMARRVGRSQAVTLKCDSWRDSAGTLWQPNALASVDLPALKLTNATWLISDVIYRRGDDGTTAEVTLMPPAAFVPAPDVLLPFDWQVGQELPNGGAANYAPAPR
jgi:prophage tail gpP-like protein